MNQFAKIEGKTIFWIVGFLVPLLIVAVQVLFGVGSTPLIIFALTWFGVALLIYLGVYEE